MQRWRWMVEELGPELKYIKGPEITTADVFRRLTIEDPSIKRCNCSACLCNMEASLSSILLNMASVKTG